MEANSSGARVFSRVKPGAVFTKIQEIENPQGRLHSSDLGSDRPGRVYKPGGGHLRHALGSFEDPKGHQKKVFARELASVLQHGWTTQQYAVAILVADPHLLGEIQMAMDEQTRKRVRGVGLDLMRYRADEIQHRLAEVMAEIDADPRWSEAS